MGTVDIYHSRRTNYIECSFYARDEKSGVSPSEWVLKNRPNGSFYAKEVSPQSNQMGQVSNVFAYDRNIISLESDDDLSGIKRGYIVVYNNKAWIVDTVQAMIHRKETEFNIDIDYKYIVNIRR